VVGPLSLGYCLDDNVDVNVDDGDAATAADDDKAVDPHTLCSAEDGGDSGDGGVSSKECGVEDLVHAGVTLV